MAYRPSNDQITSMMSEPMSVGEGEVGQDPMEAAALGAAEELDQERDSVVDSMSPAGSYSLEALNDLVDSLNKVLPMFDEPNPYPSFSEGIEGELPTEFTSALIMVGQAAADAGLERLAPDIGTMGDDAGLDQAARRLDTLADNQTFKTFLKGSDRPRTKAPEPAPEAPPVEPALVGPPPEEMDQLLAARA